MVKPNWGTKRTCPHCSARFYDLQRQPIVCPKCTQEFDPESLVKKKRGRPAASDTKPLPIVPEIEEGLDLDLPEDVESLDENENILEDTSDFGEDEDVVGLEHKVEKD